MYQMVSLLQCGNGAVASKVLRKRRVKDLVAQVESLYLPWKDRSSALKPPTPSVSAAGGASTTSTSTAAVHWPSGGRGVSSVEVGRSSSSNGGGGGDGGGDGGVLSPRGCE